MDFLFFILYKVGMNDFEMLLIRHGNMAGDPHAFYTPPVSGCLSPKGDSQAARLAETLKDISLDRIYASPLGRALQTAQAVQEGRDLPVEVRDWLVEWRPAEDLKKADSARFEEMLQKAASLPVEQTWKTSAGESVFEMADRIVPGVQALLLENGVEPRHGGYILAPEAQGKRIALVSHGGALGVLLAHLLNFPLCPASPFGFEETGVARLKFCLRGQVSYPRLVIPTPSLS